MKKIKNNNTQINRLNCMDDENNLSNDLKILKKENNPDSKIFRNLENKDYNNIKFKQRVNLLNYDSMDFEKKLEIRKSVSPYLKYILQKDINKLNIIDDNKINLFSSKESLKYNFFAFKKNISLISKNSNFNTLESNKIISNQLIHFKISKDIKKIFIKSNKLNKSILQKMKLDNSDIIETKREHLNLEYNSIMNKINKNIVFEN